MIDERPTTNVRRSSIVVRRLIMNILFVRNGQERFVLDDLALLSQEHTVTDWRQPGRWFDPVRLARRVRRCDLVFCWFASWHALAPVLLARAMGKPSVVVVGGYDTANLPQAGYGAQRGGLPRLVARTVIRQATVLVVNSQAARREAIANAGADPAKISVIYHGVRPLPMGPLQREPLALTVGNVWRENLLRKGLLPFVQAAAHLPTVRFVLVGRWYDDSIQELKAMATPNVEFTGFVSDEELIGWYQRASVYVQASLHEGFGLSVAEAMTASCIPVVSRAGALPEVVGNTGAYLDAPRPSLLAEGVKEVLAAASPTVRRVCRERILQQFPMQRREEMLIRVVGSAAR